MCSCPHFIPGEKQANFEKADKTMLEDDISKTIPTTQPWEIVEIEDEPLVKVELEQIGLNDSKIDKNRTAFNDNDDNDDGFMEVDSLCIPNDDWECSETSRNTDEVVNIGEIPDSI